MCAKSNSYLFSTSSGIAIDLERPTRRPLSGKHTFRPCSSKWVTNFFTFHLSFIEQDINTSYCPEGFFLLTGKIKSTIHRINSQSC